MTRQHLANGFDEIILAGSKLGRTRFTPFLIGSDRGGRLGALDQVLDLHLAARLLIRTLDDHARRIAPVGVFQLIAHVLRVAEIEFGADFGRPQHCNHFLVIGDTITVEHRDDHRAELRRGIELADQGQRGLQPRHADREACRRHRFATEARHQAIVAAAAADRAEAHRAPLLVLGVEQQLNLVDRTGIVFETAHDRRIDLDAILAIITRGDQLPDLIELGLAFGCESGIAGRLAFGERNDLVDRVRRKLCALGEITTLVLAAGAQQQAHALGAEFVELIDRAQHCKPAARIGIAAKADGLQHAIEHFAVVHLHQIRPARNPERLHGVGGHHADFRICRGRSAADGIGVELHELAEPAGARLLVAVDIARAIAAIGLRQRLEILRHIARQRRREIITQADPLLVIVLEREHALVGAVLIRQELAERVGVFHRRRLHRLKAVELVDLLDGSDHAPRRGDLGGAAISQATRQAGFEFLGLFGFFVHVARIGPAGRSGPKTPHRVISHAPQGQARQPARRDEAAPPTRAARLRRETSVNQDGVVTPDAGGPDIGLAEADTEGLQHRGQ